MIKITLNMTKVSQRYLELVNISGKSDINFIISDLGVYIFVQGFPLHMFVHELPKNKLRKDSAIILYGTPDIFNNYQFLLKLGELNTWFDGSYFYFTELIKVKASHVEVLPRHTTQMFKLVNPSKDVIIKSKKDKVELFTDEARLHGWMSKTKLRDFESKVERLLIPYFLDCFISQSKNRTYLINADGDYITLNHNVGK